MIKMIQMIQMIQMTQMTQMTRIRLGLVLLPCCLLTAAASADTIVETFDGGSNDGGWTWGAADSIPAAGGNPGAYLRTTGLDTFAPRLRTTTGGSYVGDFRAAGVTAIDADFITEQNSTTGGRPMTLMLIHNNDTPGNPLDDTAAYFLGPNIPAFGEGWVSYHFDVPAAETSLPAGWLLLDLGDVGNPNPTHSWDEVIQHVSQVQFHYGDPTFFFIFQQWTLGADNIALCVEDAVDCPADVDGDGSVGVTDLTAVILAWGQAGSPADVNGDGVVGVEDLTEVILAWGVCE